MGMGRKDKKRKSQILFENDQEKPAQLARPKNTIEREIEEQNKIKNIKFAKKRKTKRELIEDNQKEHLLIKKLTNKLGAKKRKTTDDLFDLLGFDLNFDGGEKPENSLKKEVEVEKEKKSDSEEQDFEGSDFDEEELAAFGDENFDGQDSDENMEHESIDEGIDEDSSEGNETPKTDEKLADGKSESNKTVSRIPEFTSNLDTVNEKLPASGRYIPPALRGEQNALERSIRGHLNKLAASNLHSISNEFGAIFRTNAKRL